jgi:hypothetical protein
MTLSNLEGFTLTEATQIKNLLVAPGCLRARIIRQEEDRPNTAYLVMCGMTGFACILHGLGATDEVRKKGTPKQCPENIRENVFLEIVA